MKQIQIIAILLLLTGQMLALTGIGEAVDELDELPLKQLEQKLSDIDAELNRLSNYTLRSGTGAVGYRSRAHNKSEGIEWIEIDLGELIEVDQVVLVPTLFRDPNTGLRSEGFPSSFRIIAGTDDASRVVATILPEDSILPRIAPLAVSFQPIKASWVRIEASILTHYTIRETYLLKLSEIFVFSGLDNVALHKPVRTPMSTFANKRARNEQNLTDGFTPFVMDAAQGSMSSTRPIQVIAGSPTPALTIDLKSPQPLNQVNLHAANIALSIPMNRLDNWGVPSHVQVIGAKRPDFSDGTILFEYRQQSILDHGPIIMHRFPETVCRYVRIDIIDHNPVISLQKDSAIIAFSEIEVFSKGKNVAEGLQVSLNSGLQASKSTLSRLTDGLNYYGETLALRDWMNQLSRRHDLERIRPLIANELRFRYDRQKTNLVRMQWLAAFLIVVTIIIVLVGLVIRQRAITQTRERIAANLHDELGANLHAIGLFGDLAKQEINQIDKSGKSDQLVHYLEEIRKLTTHAGKTARYCTNMLEAQGNQANPIEEIKRTAELMQHDLKHELSLKNETLVQNLAPRKQIGLALFYKECVTNIIRHASATQVKTLLTASKKEICLTVSDNGLGTDIPPASLKRRARLLNAKLTVEQATEGGTKITLKLRNRLRSS